MKDSKYNDDFENDDFDEEEEQLIGNDEEEGPIDCEAEEVKEPKPKKTKKRQKRELEYEEEEEESEEEDDEYEYEDEEEDNRGSKKKIVIISIAAAVIIAAAGIVTYQKIKGNREAQEAQEAQEEQQVTEEQQQTENQDAEITGTPEETPEAIEEPVITEEPEDTIAPTSTPKPLPTATPTITPFPEETDDYYDDDYTDGYTDSQVDTINNDNSDDLISTDGTAENAEPADIIFLGDLRFRSMANVATGESALWECSSSATYSWLSDTAYPDVDSRVGEGSQIFISMGINDLTMYQSYATSINTKAAEWEEKGAKVYFVAVGPVSQNSETANADIMTFNTYMYQNLNIPFIDAYNYLVAQGFETTDGQTYTDATSKAMYDYLMGLIGR